MACVIVPTIEAVVTTVVKKKTERKGGIKNPFVKNIGMLSNMLWGGSALLAFEHIWHGEIVPWFPFLTNASDPIAAKEMLFEMGTNGIGMSLLVTAVWAGITVFMEFSEQKAVPKIIGGNR